MPGSFVLSWWQIVDDDGDDGHEAVAEPDHQQGGDGDDGDDCAVDDSFGIIGLEQSVSLRPSRYAAVSYLWVFGSSVATV